jgi:hypothetical protein
MPTPGQFVAVITIVAAHVLANIISFAIPPNSVPEGPIPHGLWMGEAALLGLWLGLGAGSWGWRIALVHIAMDALAAACVFIFQFPFDVTVAFVLCPAIANALGALAMRRLGFRIQCVDPRLDEPTRRRNVQFSLADLMVLTGAVALLLVASKALNSYGDDAPIIVALAVSSFLTSFLALWFLMRAADLRIIAITAMIGLPCVAAIKAVAYLRTYPNDVLWELMFWIAIAFGTAVATLLAFRACGYRLVLRDRQRSGDPAIV